MENQTNNNIPQVFNYFQISTELFDGPIDLLLHLVKSNELPIEKLSLSKVAEQYYEYISNMKDVDFETIGEYLVIAATLLSIKASVLLNEPIPKDDRVYKEKVVDENDPHEELLRRLKEAAVFKYTVNTLTEKGLLDYDVFTPLTTSSNIISEVKLKNHEPFMLGKALRKLLDKRNQTVSLIEFHYDSISVSDSMVKILDKLKIKNEEISFDEIITERLNNSNQSSKADLITIVVNFIAILELSKRALIKIRQDELFCNIFILKTDVVELEYSNFESEFDVVSNNIDIELESNREGFSN